MTLARTNTQILRSDGGSATVAVNSPLTGNGSQELPLGLDENYHGADGTSVTFEISAIQSGHRVTLSGAQGQESFDVMNGATGPSGAQGEQGEHGIQGIQGEQGIQGPAGQNGVDGVSPAFRFAENADGITVYVSGAQGEDSFTLYNGEDGQTYSAGPNIDITDYTISGKDWTDTITAASAYAASQGKTYTGVAPIVVNNDEDKISANCIELSAGNGIDSNLLAIGTIAVSGGLGGSFESSAFGIVPSQQVTALTSLSYYDTGVGNSNKLSGNNTNNLGWTMPSAYANVKNDIITATMPEVSSRYSYLLSYTTPVTGFTSNSGLEIRKYVGNTGTTRRVLSGNSTLGELVPEDYTNRQYLTTNAAGNMQWSDIVDSAPVVLVATSGDIPATGATDGKLYVVTGSGT